MSVLRAAPMSVLAAAMLLCRTSHSDAPESPWTVVLMAAAPAGRRLGLTVGARCGGPGSLETRVLGASAAAFVGRGEIGVRGQWDPGYPRQTRVLPNKVHMSAVAGGVYFGRREPLGSAV